MTNLSSFPNTRLRRLRQKAGVRELVRETVLSVSDLILPLFVKSGIDKKQPIASMPGHFQLTLSDVEAEVRQVAELGIPGVILFGIPAGKDALGTAAYQKDGVVQQAIRSIKQVTPELLVIADLCCCEYTDHGHCGVVRKHDQQWEVDNDETLVLLVKQAISHAEAGADVIAPSGMMDGMVAAIREGLDTAGYKDVLILSYSAKYSSALYSPFREAAEGAPNFGDRRSYQMDPANATQALRETTLDVNEGADMLMVKPAGFYLDIIRQVKAAHAGVPLAAYQVSGEFAMIKAAVAQGWLDEREVALESLLAIKRAGADFIISYFAKDVARWLN